MTGPVRLGFTLALLPLAWSAPAQLLAQADSATLHATLRGWEEDTWLQLLNRSGAGGGRLSRNGILQRFDPQIGEEYYMDFMSAVFGLSEDYDWYRHPSGARYWGGSINNRFLVTGFDVKATVPLGGKWNGVVRFNQEDRPQLHRDLVRVEFGRSWPSGLFGRMSGTLEPEKPNSDFEIQAGYRRGEGREIGAGVGVLDEFNDLIYNVLIVWWFNADTALDYERQPFTARTWAEWPIGRHLRVEAHGGVMTPTTVRAYRQLAPDSGFRQNEQYGFAGGLLEWSPTARLRLGGFATSVRALIDRTPLPLSPPEDDFVLTERTSRYGGYALADLSRRFRLETWLARTAQPELRDQRQVDSLDLDFEDRLVNGKVRVSYAAPRGFTADVAYQFARHDVLRGYGQLPAPLGSHERRVRLELGWRLGQQARVAAGFRMDPDGDRGIRSLFFDGAEGRFVVHW